MIPGDLGKFMYYKANKMKNSLRMISEKQWERIGQDYRKNLDKFYGSEMYNAVTRDYVMFGDEAFDDCAIVKK
jgi:hypothetical protein